MDGWSSATISLVPCSLTSRRTAVKPSAPINLGNSYFLTRTTHTFPSTDLRLDVAYYTG
jgi:hypothetical protein